MKHLELQGKDISIEMSIGWKGYGIYNIIADVTIDKESHLYKFHSTDSELYDKRSDDDIDYEMYQEMLYDRVDTELLERIEETIYNIESE